MLNLLRNSINAIRSVSGLDSDASAFITAAGLTDPTQKNAINILVKDMKASGLWTKMKAVYPMVGGTATSMKFNLKDPRDLDAAFRLTWYGGWTYSATGATPNGTNAYADTKLVPSVSLSLNNTHISAYSRTNATGLMGDISASNGIAGGDINIYSNYLSNAYFRIYDASGPAIANTSTLGMFTANRITSTETRNLIRGAIIPLAAASTTLNTSTMVLGCGSTTSVPGNFSTRQYAFFTIGNGLTDTENLLLNQIVEKYQVALSRGVQAAQSFYYNSAYSNEANTYLYSTQITGTTQVSAINTLINGLKANNLWAKMKAVYPFVTDKTLQADMAAQMKFNLVNPQDSDAAFRLAFSGGWTYSTNGAQPNGTNGFADTKLIPSAVLSSANSTHLSYYSRTNTTTNNGVEYGSFAAGYAYGMVLAANRNSNAACFINTNNTTAINPGNINSMAYFIGSRVSSSLLNFYRNNTLLGTNTNSATTNLSTNLIYLCAENAGSGAAAFSSKQCAFASIGDGLTDAEAALLYQLVQEYQTTLNRSVV